MKHQTVTCLKPISFRIFAPNLQNNMLTVSNLSLQFGKRVLFDDVNIMFTKGNCYGIIGANGAGKSTFLKILTGKQVPTTGNVSLEPGKRMSVLEQDHYAYDQYTVLETVLRGNTRLFDIKEEMDSLYAKPDFSDADGIKAGELGVIYEEMGGWNAESDAQTMLSNVGVKDEMHGQMMSELENRSEEHTSELQSSENLVCRLLLEKKK